MPYTENHALLRFGGPAWADQEIWSCGLRLRHLGGDAEGPLIDHTIETIGAVYDAVQAYHSAAGAGFASQAKLGWVELNAISSSTGKYLRPNQPNRLERALSEPSVGTIAVPQVAACVTFRGINNRGPGSRGRFYIPYGWTSTSPLTSTGVIEASRTLQMANAAGTFLNALASIDVGSDQDAWVPHLFGDGIGGPVDSPIVTVSVGNVLDTQRRRRNQILETYTDSTTWDGGVG